MFGCILLWQKLFYLNSLFNFYVCLASSFLVGAQNQTLILMKMEGAVEKSHNIVEKAVLRGHERSVECVAINNDGI